MIARIERSQAGFGLIEILVMLVVVGILAAITMQSMTMVVTDTRRVRTEREMDMLARAIVGNLAMTGGGARSDFGYVGDVGAFPTDLRELSENISGFASWDGPYLAPEALADSSGYLYDDWGQVYVYDGAVTLTSNGGGATITRKLAQAPSDYILNRFVGVVRDAADSLPGATLADSVRILVTVPNGVGGHSEKAYQPDSAGLFALDSLPVGRHPLRIVFDPEADTLSRYLTILPRHRQADTPSFVLASAYFSGGGSCGGSGVIVLRPDGDGSVTDLTGDGCGQNWQCVSESTPDEDGTRTIRASNSYATDVYSLEDPAANTCSILHVVVYSRARKDHVHGDVRPTVYVGGTEYAGTSHSLSTSYDDYSGQWVINPATGSGWTWEDLVDLEAGCALRGQNGGMPGYCTQVWVEVYYGP